MPDFLKNLKGLFVQENPTTTQSIETSPPPPTTVSPPSPPRTVPPPTNEGNPQMMEILLKALADNNLQGLDYFEYKQSLQATQHLGLDEATRYRSAFAMAQTMGLTLPKLQETATYYISVLEREETRFADALKQQGEGKNRTMIDEIAAMEQAATEKTAQIEALHREIAELQQKTAAMKQSVAENAQKIEAMKTQFQGSYLNLRQQIELDIQRIQQYLK